MQVLPENLWRQLVTTLVIDVKAETIEQKALNINNKLAIASRSILI